MHLASSRSILKPKCLCSPLEPHHCYWQQHFVAKEVSSNTLFVGLTYDIHKVTLSFSLRCFHRSSFSLPGHVCQDHQPSSTKRMGLEDTSTSYNGDFGQSCQATLHQSEIQLDQQPQASYLCLCPISVSALSNSNCFARFHQNPEIMTPVPAPTSKHVAPLANMDHRCFVAARLKPGRCSHLQSCSLSAK